MNDSNTRVVSRELTVTEDLLIPGTEYIDLTRILGEAIDVSGDHDIYLQDKLKVQFIKDNHAWVITQYEIRVLEEAQIGDTVKIDTRLIEVNQFFCTRRYSVMRGDTLLYEIYAKFAAIDLDRRRIVRINPTPLQSEQIIDDFYSVDFTKIKPFTKESSAEDIHIGIDESDIDENLHVNNLVYLRWAYKTLPEYINDEYKLEKIEVKYEKEILPQDTVAICTQIELDDKQQTQQVIINQTNNKIASIINLHWKEK